MTDKFWKCSFCGYVLAHEQYMNLSRDVGCPRCKESLMMYYHPWEQTKKKSHMLDKSCGAGELIPEGEKK
jgi:phage FluMu protein Com